MPRIINGNETQPCQEKKAVSTKPLPIEQPPASVAPMPMRIPPSPLRRIVVASGTRTRNSLLAFAPMNEPIKIPKTKNTPQLINLPSPVTRNCIILADGPVIPSPNSRPVAILSGQAASAINPINTAEKNGCQRFSNNK